MTFAKGMKLIDSNYKNSKTYITGNGNNCIISIELGHPHEPGLSQKLIDELISYGWEYYPDYKTAIFKRSL